MMDNQEGRIDADGTRWTSSTISADAPDPQAPAIAAARAKKLNDYANQMTQYNADMVWWNAFEPTYRAWQIEAKKNQDDRRDDANDYGVVWIGKIAGSGKKTLTDMTAKVFGDDEHYVARDIGWCQHVAGFGNMHFVRMTKSEAMMAKLTDRVADARHILDPDGQVWACIENLKTLATLVPKRSIWGDNKIRTPLWSWTRGIEITPLDCDQIVEVIRMDNYQPRQPTYPSVS